MKDETFLDNEEIEKLAEEILAREVTNMPFDFQYRRNMEEYPEINHKELGLPGIYQKTEDSIILVQDGNTYEMDYIESVLPDGEKIFRNAAINAEQETGHITSVKKEKIFEYYLNSIIKLKKIVYPYVITNYDYKSDFIDYVVENCPIRINLIIFNDKKVEKVLNTLKNKDYYKEEFTGRDHVRFNHCLIFAKKPYACEVVVDLAKIFTTIQHVTLDIRCDLFTALCMMIKYHLSDYNAKKELIVMMLQSMTYEQRKKLTREERREFELAKLLNDINIKDKIINQKDVDLRQKDEEILKLRKLIRENNIKF